MRKTLLVMLCTAGIHLTAQAGEFGTADEAKAMLEKAVAAVEADKASALEKFTKGEDGFKDRDLYPYCGGPDGTFTAHPTLVGKSLKELKDKEGKALGEEIYAKAQPGTISEVAYMWPRPGTDTPVEKVTFVTKADDQVCVVGYYK
ncbi:chemotaxis protein [Azotobacter chroococcum]|uniref:Chemotaxis protein n=1 Tax=Azotobacter chroococcum TaxID=353 RepID=A0AA43Z897_9GAMM|nr:cache domain-containing protein [Azotobacter chroococcum]NHN78779.1 chemotaxis protein [Azotobacter chroococcum]